MRRRRASSSFGSTVVEVLMAISVLAVGASGILAMQKITVVANRNAKNLAVANEIARTWMDRLQADSMLWNQSAREGTADIDSDTRWLALNVREPSAQQWFRPVDTTTGIAGVHDAFGRDDRSGKNNGPYCVNLRLTWLRQQRDAIRAEVRVYWLRENIQAGAANLSIPTPVCGNVPSPAPVVDGREDIYHIVHLASALVMNRE